MHELPVSVNFRKRMKFISIQDRFYMNSFPVAKRVADPITFRRMQSSRQFQNHTEQCYLAKKKEPVGSANEITPTLTCMPNIEFCVQTVYSEHRETAFGGGKKLL